MNADGLEGTVVIGDNSQVLGDVQIKDSVIGRNCTIEAGVRLNRCVIWDNTYIKKGARITDSVICSNVRVGQGAVLEEGVIVADDTSIGDEALHQGRCQDLAQKDHRGRRHRDLQHDLGREVEEIALRGGHHQGALQHGTDPGVRGQAGLRLRHLAPQGELRAGRPRFHRRRPACSSAASWAACSRPASTSAT